jgi:hypothetical protein
MNQLSFDTSFVRAPRERIRRIAGAARSHLLAAAVIAAIVAMVIAARVVAVAVANREVMEAFRGPLRLVAQAMGLPG